MDLYFAVIMSRDCEIALADSAGRLHTVRTKPYCCEIISRSCVALWKVNDPSSSFIVNVDNNIHDVSHQKGEYAIRSRRVHYCESRGNSYVIDGVLYDNMRRAHADCYYYYDNLGDIKYYSKHMINKLVMMVSRYKTEGLPVLGLSPYYFVQKVCLWEYLPKFICTRNRIYGVDNIDRLGPVMDSLVIADRFGVVGIMSRNGGIQINRITRCGRTMPVNGYIVNITTTHGYHGVSRVVMYDDQCKCLADQLIWRGAYVGVNGIVPIDASMYNIVRKVSDLQL